MKMIVQERDGVLVVCVGEGEDAAGEEGEEEEETLVVDGRRDDVDDSADEKREKKISMNISGEDGDVVVEGGHPL